MLQNHSNRKHTAVVLSLSRFSKNLPSRSSFPQFSCTSRGHSNSESFLSSTNTQINKQTFADLPSLPHLAGVSRILEPSPTHCVYNQLQNKNHRCQCKQMHSNYFRITPALCHLTAILLPLKVSNNASRSRWLESPRCKHGRESMDGLQGEPAAIEWQREETEGKGRQRGSDTW